MNILALAPLGIPIFIDVQGGLANRLRVLSSFYNFAKIKNRKLFMCWDRGNGWSDEMFWDLFESSSQFNLIDRDTYKWARRIYFDLAQYVIRDYKRYGASCYYRKPIASILRNISSRSFCFSGQLGMDELFPEHYSQSPSILPDLQLKPNLQNQVDRFAKQFSSRMVGIHIRRGDSFFSTRAQEYKISDDNAFIEAIKKECKENSGCHFYLSTDCEETQNKFLSLFPGLFIVNTEKRFFKSMDPMAPKLYQADALVDLILLSKTTKIIGNNFSTFSDLAAATNPKPLIIARNSQSTN